MYVGRILGCNDEMVRMRKKRNDENEKKRDDKNDLKRSDEKDLKRDDEKALCSNFSPLSPSSLSHLRCSPIIIEHQMSCHGSNRWSS